MDSHWALLYLHIFRIRKMHVGSNQNATVPTKKVQIDLWPLQRYKAFPMHCVFIYVLFLICSDPVQIDPIVKDIFHNLKRIIIS